MGDLPHRVYLIPGMFGFGQLAGYDYFGHMQRAIARRFEEAGVRVVLQIVPTPPTASIRRRARVLALLVSGTANGHSGPIHLVGHSTGGLDARLIASPSTNLEMDTVHLKWTKRLASVVTINTPHFGTPLAQFFTTVAGTRLLYALSLLTFTTLRYGGPPLTILSSLIAAAGRVDDVLGADVRVLDRSTDLLLRFIGDKGRDEVHKWLDGIHRDQGGIVQLMPEAMDLFNATTQDGAHVRYASVATAAPAPTPMRFVTKVRSPIAALSATLYSTLHTVTSRPSSSYPYPTPSAEHFRKLTHGIDLPIDDALADGVVPTYSMLWGRLLWAGAGDHLDIVGHFHDETDKSPHVDWLISGSNFDRRSFSDAMDSIAMFLLDKI